LRDLQNNADNEGSEIMKIYLLALLFIFISSVSATPQVFFTSVNLTINDTSYHLWGEGLDAKDNFVAPINYEKYNIPITIAREMYENESDNAILMRALADNINMSNKWEDCVSDMNELSTNLSICEIDRGYKQNNTACQNDLYACNSDKGVLNQRITTLNEELSNVKTHRMILIVLVIILGIAVYFYHNKFSINKVKSPYAGLPTGARI